MKVIFISTIILQLLFAGILITLGILFPEFYNGDSLKLFLHGMSAGVLFAGAATNMALLTKRWY